MLSKIVVENLKDIRLLNCVLCIQVNDHLKISSINGKIINYSLTRFTTIFFVNGKFDNQESHK